MNAQDRQDILKQLLLEKGIVATSVYYYSSWSWDSERGWYAQDESGNSYKLGKIFEEAKENIIKGEIQLEEK